MNRQKTFDTPILFLVFNRPETTSIVFEQIKKIKPSKLFIAADGPRDYLSEEIIRCNKVKQIVSQIDWPCEIKTLFREKNLGCKLAVSIAITWFFDQVDYGIVLEDDCLPDLTFFTFCEELLIEYKNDSDIMLIGGNNFHKNKLDIASSYYFSNYSHIWGWASWRRAWKTYSLDISDYSTVLNQDCNTDFFQSKNEKKYWLQVLGNVAQGNINTWDYQWTYAIWKNKGKSITPSVNMIKNIGLDENSTHLFVKDSFRDNLQLFKMKFPLIHPASDINKKLDNQTYKNVYSKSLSRAFRLFKENSVVSLYSYFLKKIK
ncbi:MAG: hypothetical protein ACI87N_000254 [Flavobacteriales bacterium]|jgi:hypothetical protein